MHMTTPGEAYVMALGFNFVAPTLTKEQEVAKDWALAASFDKKGDAYQAAGNTRLAAACRALALNAANRAAA